MSGCLTRHAWGRLGERYALLPEQAAPVAEELLRRLRRPHDPNGVTVYGSDPQRHLVLVRACWRLFALVWNPRLQAVVTVLPDPAGEGLLGVGPERAVTLERQLQRRWGEAACCRVAGRLQVRVPLAGDGPVEVPLREAPDFLDVTRYRVLPVAQRLPGDSPSAVLGRYSHRTEARAVLWPLGAVCYVAPVVVREDEPVALLEPQVLADRRERVPRAWGAAAIITEAARLDADSREAVHG